MVSLPTFGQDCDLPALAQPQIPGPWTDMMTATCPGPCAWCTAASDTHPRDFLVTLSSGVFLLQDGLRPAKGANTQVSRFSQCMCSAGVVKVRKMICLQPGIVQKYT